MTLPENLPAALRAALLQRGYDSLTEVQSASTHPDMTGRDLLVSARTGSGKTVAFGLAIAPELLGGEETFLVTPPGPLGLVIAPTRELALQVAGELRWLYEGTNARIATCVGGMDMRDELRALERGAHIVVGTPGRLSDHIRRQSLDTMSVRAIVLDEADEMLDLGFREELEHILRDTPESRRTLMFSATVPQAITTLAARYQKNTARITTQGEHGQHADIAYDALLVAPGDEENAIVNIIRHSDSESAIVFCSTRASVNHLVTRLGNRGFTIVALSGEFSQKERANALHALRSGRARVCIATDVAARGLDLPKLDLVIHADIPRDPATLLHRSGRTGRAGRKGTSTLIVPPKARRRVERLLQEARISAEWGRPPSAEDVNLKDEERLLADPALSLPPGETETAMIDRLLATYPAQYIAAAFIRKVRAGRSAPEHLREVSAIAERRPRQADDRHRPERERQAHDRREHRRSDEHVSTRDPGRNTRRNAAIRDAAWIEVNVGRRKNADPKWLLPMLCKAAGIDRDQIGEIRIHPGNTHIELTRQAAACLFETTGNGRLEGSLQAFPIEGVPEPRVQEAEEADQGRARLTRPGQSAGRPARPARDAAPPEPRAGREKAGTRKPSQRMKGPAAGRTHKAEAGASAASARKPRKKGAPDRRTGKAGTRPTTGTGRPGRPGRPGKPGK